MINEDGDFNCPFLTSSRTKGMQCKRCYSYKLYLENIHENDAFIRENNAFIRDNKFLL